MLIMYVINVGGNYIGYTLSYLLYKCCCKKCATRYIAKRQKLSAISAALSKNAKKLVCLM